MARNDSGGLAPIRGARLGSDGVWVELAEAPGSGFQAWPVDDSVVVNPHFGPSAGGGIYDLRARTWSALPPGPASGSWRGDMAGVLGRETAIYEYARGWIFDLPALSWIEIPPLDDRDAYGNSAQTGVGRDLFVFGGKRAAGDRRSELRADAWMWRAPTP